MQGIGVGRCGSNADLLKQFFTPHVVMVSSVSVIVIVMVTVGLTYYCYKMKTENRIEPSEEVGVITNYSNPRKYFKMLLIMYFNSIARIIRNKNLLKIF